MALVAWYPLNGDLKNYGAFGGELTNKGAVISNNGKIGRCYDTTNNCMYTDDFPNMSGNSSYSIWAKSTREDKNISGMPYTIGRTNNKYVDLAFNSKRKISWNIGDGTSNTFNTIFGNFNTFYQSPTDGRWHNYIVTNNKDTNKATLFVDGEEVAYAYYREPNSYGLVIGEYINASTTYLFKGLLNDFRAYNHILSKSEIKEISKGLILHYDFENVVVPYTNEAFGKENKNGFDIYNNKINGINANATLKVLKNESFEGRPIYRLTMSTDNEDVLDSLKTTMHNHGITMGNKEIEFQQNIPVTYGILYRNISHKDTIVGGTPRNIGNAEEISAKKYSGEWYRVGQWRKNINEDTVTDNFYTSFMCPSLKLNEEVIIDFCCPEQYRGIDFLPERITYEKDADLTIYDSSGYGHDGALSGGSNNGIFRGNGIRGNYCMEMVGSGACYINAKKIFYSNENQCHTVSAWVKLQDDTIANQQLVNFNSGYKILHAVEQEYYKQPLLSYQVNPWCYVYGKGKLELNKWTYLVFVLDKENNIMKIYKNGLNVSLTEVGDLSTTAPYGITKDTYFGVNFKGLIDDIRVYATALDDNEIYRIYKESAKIDNNGNLYCNKLVETNNLQYIESNGEKQYINTKIKQTANIEIMIDFEFIKTDGNNAWQPVFGQRKTVGSNMFMIWGHGGTGQVALNYGTIDTGFNINQILESRSTIKLFNKKWYLNDEMIYDGSEQILNNADVYLYIFASGLSLTGADIRQTKMKLYQLKIWDSGNLVRDFIPAISVEQGHIGEICLYDMVSNDYFYNEEIEPFQSNLDNIEEAKINSCGITNCAILNEGKDIAKIIHKNSIFETNQINEF